MCLCSLEKIDVNETLAYFERLDNGDVSDVCAPSNEDEFVSSDSSVTPESSVGNIPCGGAENIPNADDDGFLPDEDDECECDEQDNHSPHHSRPRQKLLLLLPARAGGEKCQTIYVMCEWYYLIENSNCFEAYYCEKGM